MTTNKPREVLIEVEKRLKEQIEKRHGTAEVGTSIVGHHARRSGVEHGHTDGTEGRKEEQRQIGRGDSYQRHEYCRQ